MLVVRSGRGLKLGLTAVAALVALNHGVAYFRAAASGGTPNVKVAAEGGLLGHSSIGIDESSLASSGAGRFLQFATLGQWDYRRDKTPPCPKPIAGLSGQSLSSVGFMYPLESGEKVKSFCLLRSTQTCCYGPRPQYNQYILVETPKPVAFARLAPVLVHGRFFADPQPDEGFIYRMEADSVRPVEEDLPDVDPARASQESGLPLFDYVSLGSIRTEGGGKSIPPDLSALDGKRVLLSGFCVDRTKDSLPRLIVSRTWWDGVSQGKPPTVYNSVIVRPADADQVPPLWKPEEVFTGRIWVNRDPASWAREGIAQLQEAKLGAPGHMRRSHGFGPGAPVPWPLEVVLLLCVLGGTLTWKREG